MKTSKSCFLQGLPALWLLVLVPHRDARLPLRAWSASLFAAGLPGAWSFPWVAPLAVLNCPLPAEDLKRLARSMRQQADFAGGKFSAGSPAVAAIPSGGETLSVFGPALSAGLETERCPILPSCQLPAWPLIIGAALLNGALPEGLPTPPHISFRAAALANMSYCPLPGGAQSCYSFQWKIGALHWLPKKGEEA